MPAYTYTGAWSEEDQAYIGRGAVFPSLAAHGVTAEAALCAIGQGVRFVEEDTP